MLRRGETSVPKGAYNPETIAMLRAVLDDAWASLTSEQQMRTLKSELALQILNLAELGVRDPAKLRAAALMGVASVTGDAESA
jgi:hypothetical protein